MSTSMENPGQLEALLADYAAGGLSLPANALVSAHLELSETNRGFVGELEEIGADWLDQVAPETLSGRDAMLTNIFSDDGIGDEPALETSDMADDGIPQVIKHALGLKSGDIPWKSRLGGVREVRTKFEDGSSASLLWIKAGQTIPTHTHDGQELTLVLHGAFDDQSGRFARGDIAVADDDVDHMPVADPAEDCICFVVMDAPLRFTGPVTRFLNPLLNR